jgi:hypothetical protein
VDSLYVKIASDYSEILLYKRYRFIDFWCSVSIMCLGKYFLIESVYILFEVY